MKIRIRYRELLDSAIKASKNAYAPYSKFEVGAAVLTSSGKIYTGANIENVSYGLTICAERVAIFKAVSNNDNKFEAIAIAGPKNLQLTPCGACRQVINEFAPSSDVIILDKKSKLKVYKINSLLPQAFSKIKLKKILDKD